MVKPTAARSEELVMSKTMPRGVERPVKIEDLVKHYLSEEDKREIEQFYKDIGLGHYITDPSSQPPYPEPGPGPLFGNYGAQTVNCPLHHKTHP